MERGGAWWNDVKDPDDVRNYVLYLITGVIQVNLKTVDFKKTHHNSSVETALYIYITQDIKKKCACPLLIFSFQ